MASILSTLPKELPLDFLKTITDDFSDERIVGMDIVGTDYQGILPGGEVILVKKVYENSQPSRDNSFANKVLNIMALRHENLVTMVGYCHEVQKITIEFEGRYIMEDVVQCLICYEYLPKGSLNSYLYGIRYGPTNRKGGSTSSDNCSTSFDWSTRFKIIKGICQGVKFMHKLHCVHTDLQPHNIFLDDKMVAKIANFGISKHFSQAESQRNTENFMRSIPYMAPEYLFKNEISPPTDIYSLGLIMIEIATGEKNMEEPPVRQLIERVQGKWTPAHIASNYSSLDAECLHQIGICIEIGLECVQNHRAKRPSLETIVNKLNAC